jgi:hypothetical protein
MTDSPWARPDEAGVGDGHPGSPLPSGAVEPPRGGGPAVITAQAMVIAGDRLASPTR